MSLDASAGVAQSTQSTAMRAIRTTRSRTQSSLIGQPLPPRLDIVNGGEPNWIRYHHRQILDVVWPFRGFDLSSHGDLRALSHARRKQPLASIPSSLIRLFSPIEKFLVDESISRILVDGPDRTFIERDGRLFETDVRYPSADLEKSLVELSRRAGKPFCRERPCLEAMLKDGTRFIALRVPVVQRGPVLAIERSHAITVDWSGLIDSGVLTTSASDFLKLVITAPANILVAAPPSGFRTTFLEALLQQMPPRSPLVVIQDGGILPLLGREVIRLSPQKGGGEVRPVTTGDLVYSAGRLGASRIVTIDVRLSDTWDIVSQLAARAAPTLMTLPAFSADDAIARLEGMAKASAVAPRGRAVPSLIGSGLDIVIEVIGPMRRVGQITAVALIDGRPHLTPVFAPDASGALTADAQALEALIQRWTALVPPTVGHDFAVSGLAIDSNAMTAAIEVESETPKRPLTEDARASIEDQVDVTQGSVNEAAPGAPRPVPRVVSPTKSSGNTGHFTAPKAVGRLRAKPKGESRGLGHLTQALEVSESERREVAQPPAAPVAPTSKADPLRRLSKSLTPVVAREDNPGDSVDDAGEATMITMTEEPIEPPTETRPVDPDSEKTFSQILRQLGQGKEEPTGTWERVDERPVKEQRSSRRDRHTNIHDDVD